MHLDPVVIGMEAQQEDMILINGFKNTHHIIFSHENPLFAYLEHCPVGNNVLQSSWKYFYGSFIFVSVENMKCENVKCLSST